MNVFGLIGYPLGHSFSEKYFNEKFRTEGKTNCIYRNFELLEISALSGVLDTKNLIGLNVTIPYKKQVLNFCSEISSEVEEIGAANTLLLKGSDLKAYNTDYIGFRESLKELPFDKTKKALILGSGGSSSAIQYALKTLDIKTLVVSRMPKSGQISYSDIDDEIMGSVSLIVNCTPLGMQPDIETYPDIPYDLINKNHFCYDLVYNPEMTSFLRKSEESASGVKNGLEMLILQAEASWEIWKKYI